jgi:uncharacterized membrane protein YidH (DUF202 family)
MAPSSAPTRPSRSGRCSSSHRAQDVGKTERVAAYTDRAVAYVLAAVVYVAVGAYRWQQDRHSIEPQGPLHVVVWTLILGSLANVVIWVAFNR